MKIVVIEQERDLMVSLERYLLQLHHDVKDYFDPVNAINELPASRDALIIDVNIPRIKFEEVCNIFTNKFPNIEVIILLDDFQISSELTGKYPSCLFLTRPFLSAELIQLLDR